MESIGSNFLDGIGNSYDMSGYTTREVAKMVGLEPHQIRHYVRRRLLDPYRGERGEYRFSFQDIVILKSAKGLLESAVTARKSYKILLNLQKRLERMQSLSAIRIYADGDRVVVRDQNLAWDAETGQGQLDFSVSELVGDVAELANEHLVNAQANEAMDSQSWYNLGLDLEEVDSERAPEAYQKALQLDPENSDAHVNLGRLLQLAGNLKLAKHHYELAIKFSAEHQLAFYNLGTIYDELDEVGKAAEYYRHALSIPDAHFNLSRISEIQGDQLSAVRYMRNYRELLEAE